MDKEVLNSEILYLYDCKECNPNGDIDNENKPRMDLAKGRVLVSDVRLKRYIRDYFQDVKKLPIFVSKVNGKTVDATARLAYFIAGLLLKDEKYKDKLETIRSEFEKDKNFKSRDFQDTNNLAEFVAKKKHWDIIDVEDFLKHFIDVRLFGITLPIKDEKRGSSITYTGPAQFMWGYSLNIAELIESSSITSCFAGATKGKSEEGGAIGKDWRIYYALIAFYGRISGNSAEKTMLSNKDVESFDEAVWNSIITETNTRTKLGQQPRFYLRVEFKDRETFIGDLRRYIDIDRNTGLRDVKDYTLNVTKLAKKLSEFKEKIRKVVLKIDEDINIEGIDNLKEELTDKLGII